MTPEGSTQHRGDALGFLDQHKERKSCHLPARWNKLAYSREMDICSIARQPPATTTFTGDGPLSEGAREMAIKGKVVVRLHALAALVAPVLFATASTAQQMTWSAEARLVPQAGSKVSCPETTRQYQLTFTQGTLSVRTPRGETKTGQVAPDGSVSMNWQSPIGATQLVGHATSKTLRLSVPNALPGCAWDLVEVAPVEAPGAITWKTVIQLAAGNIQTCSIGDRGSAQIVGSELVLYGGFNLRADRPMLGVQLKPDGSADVDTRTALGRNSQARVKVPPGTGPRPLQFVTYTNVCTYRVVPAE